jgi:hypothetical protein
MGLTYDELGTFGVLRKVRYLLSTFGFFRKPFITQGVFFILSHVRYKDQSSLILSTNINNRWKSSARGLVTSASLLNGKIGPDSALSRLRLRSSASLGSMQ